MAPPAAQAAIIYSNIGVGDTYDLTAGLSISGPDSDTFAHTQGAAFTPLQDAFLGQIEVAAGCCAFSGANELEVSIREDVSGSPAAIVESFHFSGQMGVFDNQLKPLLSANSVLHPFLTAGTQYWFVLAPGAADTDAGWYFNSTGARGLRADSVEGGPFAVRADELQGAFRVTDSTAVPAPSSLMLVALGGGFGLLARAWKRWHVKGIGQIEIDELYVGVNKNSAQFTVPVQAK